MEDEQEVSGGRHEGLRDGSIDFTRYSLEQLNELQFTLDKGTFPTNYANLLAELRRRSASQLGAPPQESPHDMPPQAVRFTTHDGLRGWLEAKSRWLPLYGEGFVEMRSQEIVLVLLDLTMPRLDGVEALQKLRCLQSNVPVLVMSGYSEQDISKHFAGLGAGGFIQKPFLPPDLVTKVCQLLPSSK